MVSHRLIRLVLIIVLAGFVLTATARDDTKARLKESALVLMGRAELTSIRRSRTSCKAGST